MAVKEFFTTRELAVAIWILVFLAWAGTRSEIRRSGLNVLRAALHWKLLVPFVLIAAYTVLAVRGLYAAGLWTPDLLKDTIMWFLFSGVALAFSGFKIDPEVSIWRRALADQLKVIVLVEYLLNTYTFSFWIEMIMVPALAMVALFDAVARTDVKYSVVVRLTAWLQAFIGLAIISFAIHQAVLYREKFQALDAIRAVTLVPVLSILFMPCIYLLFLLSAYEQLFLRLKLGTEKDRAVLCYARRKLIEHLGLRPQRVRAFIRGHALDLMGIATKSDVDKLLQQSVVNM
jgi:hypothetical protein